MVVICPTCSGVDYDALAAAVGEDNIETTCIGLCADFEDQYIGYVNGEYISVDSQEEFVKVAKDGILLKK